MDSGLKIIQGGQPQALEDLSDDELMLLAAADRKAPLGVLIDRHQPVVLGFSTRFLGDHAAAEDVTQEVFLTLWAERRRYEPRGRLRSYLLTLAVNRCRTTIRQRRTSERS